MLPWLLLNVSGGDGACREMLSEEENSKKKKKKNVCAPPLMAVGHLDLRFILGSYFERYSVSAKTQRESHVGRRPLQIREPGLVVQTTGHMRAFWGRVYDPGLLPAGVGFNEIR